MKTIIVGLGDMLKGDEGVGVHCARALGFQRLPENVKILEMGTAFLDSAPILEEVERVIILNSIKANGKPGTIYRLYPTKDNLIAHGLDVAGVIAITQQFNERAQVIILGVEPNQEIKGLRLSDHVLNAIPMLIDAIKMEVALN